MDLGQNLQNFTKSDIFTPDNIAKMMSSYLSHKGSLLEPCVGTGNLLKYIDVDKYDEIDIYEIKQEYLQKITNDTMLFNRLKRLKRLNRLNMFHCDFIKTPIHKRYDNIILNPPYIKIQDLPLEYRDYINEHFDLLQGGAIDIYYAFIIKCLDLLCDTGVMVSITPNSYLYNKTTHKLRKYLFDNRLIKEIIDFKDKKVFSNASVYCCITIYSKDPKTHLIYNDTPIAYNDIVKNYSLFNFNSSENTLRTLCIVRNGIATLRNNIYIHSTKLYDEPCWRKITNGASTKYIIYPYKDGKIIDEDTFKSENRLTFEYLVKNKEELEKRDNGKKAYPTWYAYGRSQSIKCVDKKCIYIPCFIDPNPNTIHDHIFTYENILHYGCLCIEPKDEKDIERIKNVIIDNIEFIKNNSSKRSAGWINLNSSLLYNLPLLY